MRIDNMRINNVVEKLMVDGTKNGNIQFTNAIFFSHY